MRIFPLILTMGLLTLSSTAFAALEDYPSIKLQGLDKSVGRTITFEAKVGSTIQYGPLFIKIHACRKAPPIETPESAAFLQIWEVPPGSTKSEWVFSGWMFASSPALSAMDHPVYDVWVLDCTGKEEPNEEAAAAHSSEQADQTTLPETGEAPSQADHNAADLNGAHDSQSTPAGNNVDLFNDADIPMDGEAEQDAPVQSPAQMPQPPEGVPAFDPDAPYSPALNQPQQQPAPTYQNPYDAPYSPPSRQPVPVAPGQEGIYSPSQGRVVPVYPR